MLDPFYSTTFPPVKRIEMVIQSPPYLRYNMGFMGRGAVRGVGQQVRLVADGWFDGSGEERQSCYPAGPTPIPMGEQLVEIM